MTEIEKEVTEVVKEEVKVTPEDVMASNEEVMKELSKEMDTTVYQWPSWFTVLNIYPISQDAKNKVIEWLTTQKISYLVDITKWIIVVKAAIPWNPELWIENNMKWILTHSCGVTLAWVVTPEEKKTLGIN